MGSLYYSGAERGLEEDAKNRYNSSLMDKRKSLFYDGQEQGMARDAESAYNANRSANMEAINAQWDAGANDRLAENLKGTSIDMTNQRSLGDGNLSGTEAGVIGAGVEAVAGLVGGALQAGQTRKQRKKAERDAMAQIGETRERNQQIQQREDAQFENEKAQARWGEMIKNQALRQDMMSRDIDKAIQRYQEQQDLIKRFNQNPIDNEMFKMALAERM